jgi:hypothetical protein
MRVELTLVATVFLAGLVVWLAVLFDLRLATYKPAPPQVAVCVAAPPHKDPYFLQRFNLNNDFNSLTELTNSLTTLSTEQAEELLTLFNDSKVVLDGLTVISPEVALTLAKCSVPLELNGLNELSPEAAEALVDYSGDSLSIDGLTSISEEAANALGNCQCRQLSLNGLKTLSVESADGLARFMGDSLFLHDLTILSPEAAEELAGFRGELLQFGEISTHSPKATDKLKKFQGKLVLGSQSN